MRRRLLFGKFDHIEIHRNGEIVTEMDINVGELIADLEVFGVYKSGRKVRVKNSDCVWESEGSGVVVGVDNGQVTGVINSDIPVAVKATYSKGGNTYEATVEFTVHLYTYKYFVNANSDATMGCKETTATFGYSLYKTTYDNGNFVKVEASSETISLMLSLSGDITGSRTMNGNSIDITVSNNKHSLTSKNYTGTFVMGGPGYEIETVNFGGVTHSDHMTVVHLGDSSNESDNVRTYGELSVTVDNINLTFANAGETKTVTASTTQPTTLTTYWASDNTIKDIFTEILTDEATFAWSGSLTPFSINTTTGKTVNVSVGTTSSSVDVERTLTVRATSTKDASKTAMTTVLLIQGSKTIVGYEDILLKEATSVNPVVPAKGGMTLFSGIYQQVARWSDGSTTIVEIPPTNIIYVQHEFSSLGTTPTIGETVVKNGITVSVLGLGESPATAVFYYDAKQAENKLVKTEYLAPTISYSGENPIIIPASGGSATADTTKVTVSQKKKETYSSEATIEKDADVSGATKNASTVTAPSLGTTSKPQTKVGDSTITVLVNGQTGTLNISVEQAENISHDGKKGTTVTYSDWNIYFTNDTTTSNQDIYLDEKFGDDQYIEPDNANNTYNNTEETYSEIGKMGATKDVHIRAVRVKSTKYYYSSGEPCHIVKEPDYYGDTVKSGLTVSCSNGVSMGTVSSPNAQNVLTSTFPNPGSNHTLAKKSWTVTVNLGGKTVTKTISQEAGVITWDDKTPSVVYTEAAPTEGAQSTHTAIDASMKWHWNDDTDKTTVTATASYELVGTVPSGTTINATTGVITWPKNDDDSRNVTVKITLTANSGVAGDTAKVVSNEVTATQKSGLIVDHYTITGYRVYVNSETQNIGAAGGSFGISRGGSVTYTETYVSGTTSSAKTKDIPADKISVAESGDTYNTFSTASWNGANATVSVDSHKTAVRNAQTIVYTPSITEANLRSLFDKTVNSIGTATVETLNISQAKNEKRGSVYGDVSLNPTSKDITFDAMGGTIDTEVTASQTYYDYYSSYEDGDTVNGKTTLMNVTSFTFAEPVESGSYLDDFTASHQLISEKHYVRIVANINTLTSGKNGYSATMQVTGADSKKASIVINVSQNAGTETYKFFIVAGADKNLAVTGTSADFTYKLYRTTYVSGVYISCAEANGTVTGTYGDSISSAGSSTNGTMSKAVSSNAHNTSTKKYSVTFAIPSGTAQETTNFDGKTADYTQVITHLADSLDDTKTVVTYTDYKAWIGSESTSASNVSPISFNKAGENRTLYGFSTEVKTTYYYWKSDSTEDVASREVETLKNQSNWTWSQESSTVWTLSNKTSQNASEAIGASAESSQRTIVVTLTATSTYSNAESKPESTMIQEAGLNYKYFVVANDDYSIGVKDTVMVFGFKIIRNDYDGAGRYINSRVYNGEDAEVEYIAQYNGSDITSRIRKERTVTVTVEDNRHNTTEAGLRMQFYIFYPSDRDTVNTNVIDLEGNTYVEDQYQWIYQDADNKGGDEYVEYSEPEITLSKVTFAREGENKYITALPRVKVTTYSTWSSDGEIADKKSETYSDNAGDWDWSWSLKDGNPFSINGEYVNTNPTKVAVGENETTSSRTDVLTVTGILKADKTVSKSAECVVEQEAGNILEYLSLELIDPANDGTIGYAERATYKVWAHYSVSGNIDVTDSASLYCMTTATGSTSSPYITNPSNGNIVGNNAGEVIPEVTKLRLIADKDSTNTVGSVDLTATLQYFTEGNYASSNQTVYLYAIYGGMSTVSHDGGRKTLVVEGQAAKASTMYNEIPATDAEWGFEVAEGERLNAYLTVDTGSTNTLYPRGFGQYVVRVDSGSFYDTATINVSRTENRITATINAASDGFDINANYATESNISLSVGFKNADNSSYTATGAINGLSSEVGAPSMIAGSTITSFSGTPTSDIMYNYTFIPYNESYTGIDLIIGSSSIDYNGSAPYKVELISSNGTRRDITSICPINAYASIQYTTISNAVTISPSQGIINGNNTGSTIDDYDTLYVSPNSESISVGNTVTVTAYSKTYRHGRNSSTEKIVHFMATYMGFSDTYTSFTVGADRGSIPSVSPPSTVSANWSVNRGGTLSADRGISTTFTADSSGVSVVTASRSGYVTENNKCTITVNELTVTGVVVYTDPHAINYGNNSALSADITFSDGSTITYTTNPIQVGGHYYAVTYYKVGGNASDSAYSIDTNSIANTNSGIYVNEEPIITATPSSGYRGDEFTISISGKSKWTSDDYTVYVGGEVVIVDSATATPTGITDTVSANRNKVVLYGQSGSDYDYRIKDFGFDDERIAIDVDFSTCTAEYGPKAGKTTATVNYFTGGNVLAEGHVEVESLGERVTLVVNDVDMMIYDKNVKITASYGGSVLTDVNWYGYNTNICSIETDGTITPKNTGQTTVTASTTEYGTAQGTITINDDRVVYTIYLNEPTGYVKVVGGFDANINCSGTSGTETDSISGDYGEISVKGKPGSSIYYSVSISSDATVRNGSSTSGDIYKVNFNRVTNTLTMPSEGGSISYSPTVRSIRRKHTFSMGFQADPLSVAGGIPYEPAQGAQYFAKEPKVDINIYDGNNFVNSLTIKLTSLKGTIDILDGLRVVVTYEGDMIDTRDSSVHSMELQTTFSEEVSFVANSNTSHNYFFWGPPR